MSARSLLNPGQMGSDMVGQVGRYLSRRGHGAGRRRVRRSAAGTPRQTGSLAIRGRCRATGAVRRARRPGAGAARSQWLRRGWDRIPLSIRLNGGLCRSLGRVFQTALTQGREGTQIRPIPTSTPCRNPIPAGKQNGGYSTGSRCSAGCALRSVSGGAISAQATRVLAAISSPREAGRPPYRRSGVELRPRPRCPNVRFYAAVSAG